jgi:hypothetical protein
VSPEEICRRLGEAKVKELFLDLTTDSMKKVMREGKLPTTRLASHTSTRRRNEDWAAKLWRAIAERPVATTAATLLFEWLTHKRRPMLAEFLGSLGVKHEDGLTDADFMTETPPEKLQQAGKDLLAHHDRREVAAYLLFLDASNKSEHFAPLELDGIVGPPPTAQAAPSP